LTFSQKKYNSETTIILCHFQSLPLFRDSATLKRLEIFKNKFSVYSRTIDKKIGGKRDENRDGPHFKNQLWLNYCPAGYIIVEIITTGEGINGIVFTGSAPESRYS
jgi:hypothetical protein